MGRLYRRLPKGEELEGIHLENKKDVDEDEEVIRYRGQNFIEL